MARGNRIQVKAGDRPREGIARIKTGETLRPGMVCQISLTEGVDDHGLFTLEIYNRDADGNNPQGPYCVILEDGLAGTMETAYPVGDGVRTCRYWIPQRGDEANLIISNVSGTANIVPGLMIVDDGTGELIATTGSPEQEPFLLLETIVDNAADQWGHCVVC